MTVARILATKGRDVVTTLPHRTLREIVEVLAQKHIGAVVVVGPEGIVLGISSERDIIRAIARQGAAALDDAVSRHMTAKVVTTTEEGTVDRLMEQMTAGRFRHVPVIRNGKLDGVVSIGDVVKYRLDEVESEHRALREYIATA
ncbi:MAG TPA: CBS domain-containing protein [Beijerinckiaceae bacterium]|nr:CBS domain-containing protein [Beijerinckiaceae bacterium]